MEPIEPSKAENSLTFLKPDKAVDNCFTDSSESLPEGPSKQSVINLTRELRMPSTSARKTSEFFDGIGNLDPVKYCPPDPNPLPRLSAKSEK